MWHGLGLKCSHGSGFLSIVPLSTLPRWLHLWDPCESNMAASVWTSHSGRGMPHLDWLRRDYRPKGRKEMETRGNFARRGNGFQGGKHPTFIVGAYCTLGSCCSLCWFTYEEMASERHSHAHRFEGLKAGFEPISAWQQSPDSGCVPASCSPGNIC